MLIHKLDPHLTNIIAAGEVLERPAQLVKELIENSLDAGADELRVSVENSGRDIEITDNGKGMGAEDLLLCTERFTTSKIANEADLWKLQSFGFRGEALASAAAISDMFIRSSLVNCDEGHSLKISNGVKSKLLAQSCPPGTLIRINNLFANTPVREKFLKTEAGEFQAIRQVIKAMALQFPHVEIKYYERDKLHLHFPKENAHFRATRVLGAKKLFEAVHDSPGLKVHIYYTSPYDVQKSSRNIWLFVQQRWIQDRSLVSAVLEAYRTFLMHGEYPSAMISIEMDPATVDVNVHPSKREVKFADPSRLFRAIHHSIKEALSTSPWIPAGASRQESISPSALLADALVPEGGGGESLALMPLQDMRVQYRKLNFDNQAEGPESPKVLDNPGHWSRMQVIGQSHLTYLICDSGQELILIDQHAAHERVLFEKLMKAKKLGNIPAQEILIPLAFQAEEDCVENIWNLRGDLQILGVKISRQGPETLLIESHPAAVKADALLESLQKMAESLRKGQVVIHLEHQFQEMFSSWACHSAIRAGQALSLVQMQELLRLMDEAPQSSFCPHGRPVSIAMGFNEIERKFGRIT